MAFSIPKLVAALADGRFHTGDDLGERHGVTRAAVWKAVKKLEDFGLEVHSVRGKGYRLSEPLTLLDAGAILGSLSDENRRGVCELELLCTVDSTNAHALRKAQAGAVRLGPGDTWVCMSEMQTAGKGRRGREWVSPFGHNLYLTMLREFTAGASSLEGLSLVVGLALVRALNGWGFGEIGLKWPNDVLWRERKLAGILIEVSGDMNGVCQVVIGLGLNLKQKPSSMEAVAQPWTTLQEMGFQQQERNRLFGSILQHQLDALRTFQSGGFGEFVREWAAMDLTAGRQVELISGAGVVAGIGRGIDGSGALLLQTDTGIHRFQGGEVSLRTMPATVLE